MRVWSYSRVFSVSHVRGSGPPSGERVSKVQSALVQGRSPRNVIGTNVEIIPVASGKVMQHTVDET
jgi:hypothetical protein